MCIASRIIPERLEEPGEVKELFANELEYFREHGVTKLGIDKFADKDLSLELHNNIHNAFDVDGVTVYNRAVISCIFRY